MTQETDLAAYLAGHGVKVYRAAGTELTTHCWWCADGDPKGKGKLYLNVESWLYQCKRCDTQGNRKTLLEHFGDVDALTHIEGNDPMVRRRILTEVAEMAHDMLLGNDRMLQYLVTDRGLAPELIVERKFGYVPRNVGISEMIPCRPDVSVRELIGAGVLSVGGKEFFNDSLTIPYWSHGSVVQIREKKPDGKYRTTAGDRVRLYNADSLHGADDVLITEGEYDCDAVVGVLRNSMDRKLMATAVVGLPGAGAWPEGLVEMFEGAKRVFIGLDPDDTGRSYAAKLKEKLGNKARIVTLPTELPKCDWTDYLRPLSPKNPHGGHTARDLQDLLVQADLAGKRMFSVLDAGTRWRQRKTESPGLQLGFPGLDSVLRPGVKPGQVMIPLAKSGTGKGHPLHTKVPTPGGMRQFGDLNPGDYVFGSDGKPVPVTSVHDRGVLLTVRITFSDHTSVEVDHDHLWAVQYRQGANREWLGEAIMSTRDLMTSNLRAGHNDGEWRYRIPMARPAQYDGTALPVPAYTLGALLANGYLAGSSVVLTTPDLDVAARVHQEWPVTSVGGKNPNDCPAWLLRGAIGPIKQLGLDVLSASKSIPEDYLTACEADRWALLQGLMDGDGSNRTNSGRRSKLYHTTSGYLARDVARLVNSLGGTAMPRSVARVRNGRTYAEHTVNIMLDGPVFSSDRKSPEPVMQKAHVPHRAIVLIEEVSPQQIRCISVGAADQLYLIGDAHIVTHNTVFLSNVAHNLRRKNVLFISLEMTAPEVFEHLRRIHCFWFPNAGDADLLQDYERLLIVDQNRIGRGDLRDYIREYTDTIGSRPDLVIVDYLQYYARGFHGGSMYEKTSDAAMELKAVAKEEGVAIICPSQVSRRAEHGKPLSADDARDSGVVDETGDFVLALFRPDQLVNPADPSGDPLHQNGGFNAQILKSRHGGKGRVFALRMSLMSLVIVDPLFNKAAGVRVDQENSLYRSGLHYEDYRKTIEPNLLGVEA